GIRDKLVTGVQTCALPIFGNVMQYGYPEDWILTLGPRIKRIHVKDYKLSNRAEQGRFVGLLEGDVNWKAVMAALVKTGYNGFLRSEERRVGKECISGRETE